MICSHKLSVLAGALSILFLGGAGGLAIAAPIPEEPIVFEAGSGETVDAYRGFFEVPENRSDPSSRKIKIGYVRFPATGEKPGSPIVYLAGGPGGTGTGTARGPRFPLFMAMRIFGDVIAFDQRGTGLSDETPPCLSSVVIPDDRRLSKDESIALLKQSVRECDTFWRDHGVDLRGYTTVESARDLNALRRHLGAEKLTLWGISYGTHLALAAVKEMAPHIDKMVLASAEGLSQTVKLPARTDAYFDRVQAAIDADPKAKAIYPDIKALMRRVHAQLDSEPVMLKLQTQDGGEADFLLHGDIMRIAASAMISDPERAAMLLELYSAADHGVYEPVAGLLARFITPGEAESWRAMPLAMDVASGISDDRLALVEAQAKTALIGDYLNFPMPHLRGVPEGLDLGDAFRENPASDIATLLLSGTLDGRTYPESQREALSGMSDLTVVTVVNAGHNLFMVSPEVTETIKTFMRGEKVTKTEIGIAPPVFITE